MTYVKSLIPSLGAMRFLDVLTQAGSGTAYVFGFTGRYREARYAIVECVGAGGAGGGAVLTAAATISAGTGGGGGAYARRVLTKAAGHFDAQWTLYSGAGGIGVAGANGGAGEESRLTYDEGGAGQAVLLRADGGGGGIANTAGAPPNIFWGGIGGATGTGDLVIPGEDGGPAVYQLTSTPRSAGWGGGSYWGMPKTNRNAGNADGGVGNWYGAGGVGATNGLNQTTTTRAGGVGGIGQVLVWLYA